MSTAMVRLVDRRVGVRNVCAVVFCLWLGFGPIASAAPWSEEEHDCCCGGGSACLLGDCDCGEHGAGDNSPCGGLRPTGDANDSAVTLSFVRSLGVSTSALSGVVIETAGSSLASDVSFIELAPEAPEPPPPRSASAC